MASEKNNGKPLKLRYLQILKQNVDSDWFWVTDDEYDYIKVIHCVFSRQSNGNNGYDRENDWSYY